MLHTPAQPRPMDRMRLVPHVLLLLVIYIHESICTIPARINEADNAQRCAVFQRMTASPNSACTELSTSKPESIAATLCTTANGNWIVHFTSLLDGHQPVVRVRLTGPEVLQPPVQYCDPQSSYATFALFTPGLYRLEVLHLYASMVDFYHPAPVEEDLWLYWGHLHVTNATADAARALTVCGKRPGALGFVC